MIILVQIELPYWLEIPDKYTIDFEFRYEKLNLPAKLMVNQDFWIVGGIGKDRKASFYANEVAIINPTTIKPNSSSERFKPFGLREDMIHLQKTKSVLQFELTDEEDIINIDIDSLQIVFDSCFFLTNKILRIYSFAKSKTKIGGSVQNLGREYFNTNNTKIVFRNEEDQDWTEISKAHLIFKNWDLNFITQTLDDTALEFINERFKERGLKPVETIVRAIENARSVRDMRSFVLNIIILLESKIKPFLENMGVHHPEEISTFLKNNGLELFLKYQLPHFLDLEKEKLQLLLNEALKLRDTRNNIVHNQGRANWSQGNVQACEKTLELISTIDQEINSHTTLYNTNQLIIGTVHSTEEIQDGIILVEVMETKTEQLYNSFHRLKFNENNIRIVIDRNSNYENSDKLVEFTHPDISQEKVKMYYDEHVLFIYFIPAFSASQNDNLLDIIFNSLGNLTHTREIYIYVLYSGFPSGLQKHLNDAYKTIITERLSKEWDDTFFTNILVIGNVLRILELFDDSNYVDKELIGIKFKEVFKRDLDYYTIAILLQNFVALETKTDGTVWFKRVLDTSRINIFD